MGTVADKLNKILATKQAIKDAIIAKGQDVSNEDTFASYPDKILAIQTGCDISDKMYSVNLQSTEPEGGNIIGGGMVSEGMTVTIKAEAADNYVFLGWQENDKIISTEPIYTFVVDREYNLTAKIMRKTTCTVTISHVALDGPYDGSVIPGLAVTGAGEYTVGDTVEIVIPHKFELENGRDYGWPETVDSEMTGDNIGRYQPIYTTDNQNEYSHEKYTWTITQDTHICFKYKYSWFIRYIVEGAVDDGVLYNINYAKEYEVIHSLGWVWNPMVLSFREDYCLKNYSYTGSADKVNIVCNPFLEESTPQYRVGCSIDHPHSDITITLVIAKESRLPEEYTEVEWIQAASNSAYIKPGVALNSKSTLITKFKIPETSGFYSSSGNSYVIYGGKFEIIKMATATTLTMRLYPSSGGTNCSAYILSNKVSSTDLGKEFTIEISDKTVFINNVKQELSSYSLNATSTMLCIGSSLSSATVRVKFQYMKVTNTSSTSATYNCELIPCINPSGVVGLYDLTNAKFIPPAKDTFIAGPAV